MGSFAGPGLRRQALRKRSALRIPPWLSTVECELSTSHYEAAESRLHIQYTFVRDGKQETREISQQVYTAAEVRRLLDQAGLGTLALYGSLDQQPYLMGSPHLLLVAKRQ